MSYHRDGVFPWQLRGAQRCFLGSRISAVLDPMARCRAKVARRRSVGSLSKAQGRSCPGFAFGSVANWETQRDTSSTPELSPLSRESGLSVDVENAPQRVHLATPPAQENARPKV